MNVSATAMPVVSENSRSAGAAPTRTAPLPARMIGELALRITSAARMISSPEGSGWRRRSLTGSGLASISSSITSSGISM